MMKKTMNLIFNNYIMKKVNQLYSKQQQIVDNTTEFHKVKFDSIEEQQRFNDWCKEFNVGVRWTTLQQIKKKLIEE